jgi:3,4-dihydroxy 2-butanone 4-phosphate synthase/GTP cyclohydrolase II
MPAFAQHDDIICHHLRTDLLGDCIAVVPVAWKDSGFALLREGDGTPPLVRIQSRCTYGDVFGSHHCDCQGQLREACRLITLDSAGGIVFYLEQEGRGAGLTTKARAYRAAAATGIDSFRFYEESGVPVDSRDYQMIASLLKRLNVPEVRLLTNNLDKCTALEAQGLRVHRHALVTPAPSLAQAYIDAKRNRGHLL